jgi:hypothetical protein
MSTRAEPIVGQFQRGWPHLPPHIRDAIGTLVDASKAAPLAESSSTQAIETAWQAAQQCRGVVQACLREEEWQDAEEEFFRVIHASFSA